MHTQVWVVSYRDKEDPAMSSIMDVFTASKAIVLESMNITFCKSGDGPKIIHNTDTKIIWESGIEAQLFTVKTQADHL